MTVTFLVLPIIAAGATNKFVVNTISSESRTGFEVKKVFFMLNSTEHKISTAH